MIVYEISSPCTKQVWGWNLWGIGWQVQSGKRTLYRLLKMLSRLFFLCSLFLLTYFFWRTSSLSCHYGKKGLHILKSWSEKKSEHSECFSGRLNYFPQFLRYYWVHLFSSDCSTALASLHPYTFFICIY